MGNLEQEEALIPFPKLQTRYKLITKVIASCSLTQTRCISFKPMTLISFCAMLSLACMATEKHLRHMQCIPFMAHSGITISGYLQS